MKYSLLFSFCFFFVHTFGQISILKKTQKFLNKAWFFVDSVRVEKEELKKLCFCDITALSVYEDTTAIRMFGQDAKAGVLYLETNEFAKKRAWRYFSLKSNQYSTIVPTEQSDSIIQYILNNKILKPKNNFWGDLAFINDNSFKELRIIDKMTLQKIYKIKDNSKLYGVLIISSQPEYLKSKLF